MQPGRVACLIPAATAGHCFPPERPWRMRPWRRHARGRPLHGLEGETESNPSSPFRCFTGTIVTPAFLQEWQAVRRRENRALLFDSTLCCCYLII